MKTLSSFLFLLLCGSAGWAQTQEPGTASLSQAIGSAWQRSAERAAALGRLQRAQADRAGADSAWAAPPSLEVEARQSRVPLNGSLRETEIGVMWPMWLPGQRSARAEGVQAEVRAAEAAQQATLQKVALSVLEAAGHLEAQRAELRQSEAQASLLGRLAEDVERRVRAGDLARADALAVRAEMLAAQGALAEARQRMEAARASWRLLTGSELPARLELSPGAQPLGWAPAAVLAASAEVERARKRLVVAERSRRDPPEVGVRVRRAENVGGAENSVAVAVRVPFATRGRSDPMLAAASTELQLAIAEESLTRERVAADIATARLAVIAAQAQAQAEGQRAKLLRERADLIEKSFRAGETPLPETLRALALASQAEAGAARHDSAARIAQARVAIISGGVQ